MSVSVCVFCVLLWYPELKARPPVYLGNVVPWKCRMKGWDGNEEGVVGDRLTSAWRLPLLINVYSLYMMAHLYH